MEPYKLKILSVDPTENYYRVRFVDPGRTSECKTPGWAIGVAESVSKGSKVVMCVVDSKWRVQSVLITRKFHRTPDARRLAMNITRKIEGSNKKVPKKWAGGNIEGPAHTEGGIVVELEGGEGVLMREVMHDPNLKTYSGTNREIVNRMQLEHGGNPMMRSGGTVNDRWIQQAEAEMEKKGTIGKFTKKALRHQMIPVEYAKEVLENREKHSLTTVREAQFVKDTNPEKFAKGGTLSKRQEYINLENKYWRKVGLFEDMEDLPANNPEKQKLKSEIDDLEDKMRDFEGYKQGGIITPYKGISASIKKSIEDVLSLEKYSDLNALESGILYSKFKEYEKLDEVEGEPFYEYSPSYEATPSLEETIFEKLSLKNYVDLYDSGASLTSSGYGFIDAVNGRLQTRRLVKMGSDLFPDESGIPELVKKADEDKILSNRELVTIDKKVTKTVAKKASLKGAAIKIKNEIKEIMDKRSNRALTQDRALKAMHPGKRISKTGRVYWESRPNRSDVDRRIRMKKGGIAYRDGGNTDYQGWKNYETWNVKLWLDNSQADQEFWHERTREIYESSKKDEFLSKKENAVMVLSEELKDSIEEGNPLQEDASMYSDLLGASISIVDFREIANVYLDEIEE